MNNIIKIGLMPLLVFTVIANRIIWNLDSSYGRGFRRKKRNNVKQREVLLLSVGKMVLRNVVIGIQDVDR